ncbi:AT-rich interactive domain-containing protein 3B [Ochotona curzoniae]|uniref:AT-rich interactive domain-containing protein 3B n=1 Tax=Ochotona curzoniae TaxID=130825 RepID=UPI001B34B4B2|nr:AT-rich interactive domain-containing protein 3B [Ochotona curzoniae]
MEPPQQPPLPPPHLTPQQMETRPQQGQPTRDASGLYAQKLTTQPALLSAPRLAGSPVLAPPARVLPASTVARVFERSHGNTDAKEDEGGLEDADGDEEDAEADDQEAQAAPKYFAVHKTARQEPRVAPASGSMLPAQPGLPAHGHQAREDTKDASRAAPAVATAGQPSWNLDEQLKQNGGLAWSDDADGGRGREISRDFAKLYELDSDPERREFLDDLFVFMQKRGTPINRIPIMAKQTLDLYMLYKLVTEKGGLVEIINKKIWREITKGLNLPTSITSAAFTLRTQYMKYLYAYECEKKALSSPAELQAAIDGNRREGRRPSYSSPLFSYSPSAAAASTGAPALLTPPKIRFPLLGLGSSGGSGASARGAMASTLRKGDAAVGTAAPVPNRLTVPGALAAQGAGPRTATLEQLRERLGSGEPSEKKAARLSEEEQRLVQQAFQRGCLGAARPLPVRIRINGREDRTEASAAALNLTASSIGSIHMSVDIDGTTYAGVLFAQKPMVHLLAGAAAQGGSSSSASSASGTSGGGGSSSHCSPSPTSSRGTPSTEPSTSWSV